MAQQPESASLNRPELVVVTGLSGSGKGTVLKCFEDLGYYSVDNLPTELIPKFAELTKSSPDIRCAALGVDIREGAGLSEFPAIYKKLRRRLRTLLLFLEADDATLLRRYSETRRPHPLGGEETVSESLAKERRALQPIRELADHIVDTSRFTVHELREVIRERFEGSRQEQKLMICVTSFGFRHGLPPDSDLVFDVRFLPNPNYIPEFKSLSGRHPRVARYIRSFPQTQEFMTRISELLLYLIPHYIREGKSYLTIAFGCTGGQHRSVMMASDIRKRLMRAGYKVKEVHRDLGKAAAG
ncbi:MAG: RNase adapter RapZ [Bryobacteraceae bacterium]|nr:RNase adapter RapZ [Bryobacteraceae bacterium]MDW8379424.1 RNase adapter RapZ [Bryobacterales bacterium]